MQGKNLPAVIQSAIKQQAIDLSQVNFLMPTQAFGELLGTYDKIVIEQITINTDVGAGEVYEQTDAGGKLSLGKVPLMSISNALGVLWDPVTTTIIESTNRKARAKATGAYRKPSGEYQIISDEKTIDLDWLEAETRLAAEEKAENGNPDKISDWGTTKNGKKYPIYEQWKSEEQKQKWIDRKVSKKMIKAGKYKDELALTGAKERAIRQMLALKNSYTKEELSRPIAFPKIITDTNKLLADPEMKKAALEKMTGNINAIFGANKIRNVTQEPSQIETLSNPEEEEYAGQPAGDSQDPGIGIPDDEIPFENDSPRDKLSELLKDERVQKSTGMKKAITDLLAIYDNGEAGDGDLIELKNKVEKALSDWEASKKGGAK